LGIEPVGHLADFVRESLAGWFALVGAAGQVGERR